MTLGVRNVTYAESALPDVLGAAGVALGYRRTVSSMRTLDYGLDAALAAWEATTGVRVGIRAGITQRLGSVFYIWAEGTTGVEQQRLDGANVEDLYYEASALAATLRVGAGLDLPLIGTLRIAPFASGYATSAELLGSKFRNVPNCGGRCAAYVETPRVSQSYVGAGVELPVSVRVLDRTVTLSSRLDVAAAEPSVTPDATMALRVSL